MILIKIKAEKILSIYLYTNYIKLIHTSQRNENWHYI